MQVWQHGRSQAAVSQGHNQIPRAAAIFTGQTECCNISERCKPSAAYIFSLRVDLKTCHSRLTATCFVQVDVNFALREMTDEGKAAAELALDRIKASGGTNLSGGLFKGIDQHQQAAGQGAPSPSTNDDSGRCKHASSCSCVQHTLLPCRDLIA